MVTDAVAHGSLEATARWTAAVRAQERERPDRLIDDPWAASLAGVDGTRWLAVRTPDSVLPIVIRTRYFDDWLTSVAGGRRVSQVVLLAAGLDTRAWRLQWPAGTVLYEVDHPSVLREKARILADAGAAAACDRRAVEGDLAADWGSLLTASGFDPMQPTAWLAEGILFYLPTETVGAILGTATALSAAGSRLGFDIVNSHVLTSPWTRSWVDMQAAAGAPWIGTMDDPQPVLADLGWSATVAQPGDPGTGHGRWTLPVIPASMRDMPHSWYVTAVREG
jgi:methyltransferase (TIGR00027 family)